MIRIDKQGLPMNREAAHFAIQYLNSSDAPEFSHWMMHPKQLASDGVVIEPRPMLAGVPIRTDPQMDLDRILLNDRFGEIVVEIRNVMV